MSSLTSVYNSQVETYVFQLQPSERDVSGNVTTIDFNRVVNIFANLTTDVDAWYCVSGEGGSAQYRGQINILRGQGAGAITSQVLTLTV